jgi:subtilisin family serine protease
MRMFRSTKRGWLAGGAALTVAAVAAIVGPLAGSSSAGAAVAPAAAGARFAVVVPAGAPLTAAEQAVAANGGTVVQRWPQLGVLLARSTSKDFAAHVRSAAGVEGAGSTRNLADLGTSEARAKNTPQFHKLQGTAAPAARATTGADPLAVNQWNMRLIGADKTNETSPGDPKVLVGILDTGVDSTHPDLAANIDKQASVNCTNDGIPDPSESAWGQDEFGHGTHVAGIVAAAKNGIGVTGVAPNVRIASIKVADSDGYIYPEWAICGYLWAADHHVDIANASFSIDPWYFWCTTDPDQAAVSTAIQRAVAYANGRSVASVASLGNNNQDLSKDVVDTLSPDNGTPVTRNTDSNCRQLPDEADGVAAISSVGAAKVRYYNSNYGRGVADLTAPGGDKMFQLPDTPDHNGQVLSTLPGGTYGYDQGTSMASPHVAGVLALIKSKYPYLSGQQLFAQIVHRTDVLPCPPGGVHDPDGKGTFLAVCEGGSTGAGFYGAGLVNAVKAVS